MLVNMMNQEPGLINRVKEKSGVSDPTKKITELTIPVIWEDCTNVSEAIDFPSLDVAIKPDPKTGHPSILLADNKVFVFSEDGLAEKVVRQWSNAVSNIYKLSIELKETRKDIDTMNHAIKEMIRMLNPLIIKPTILKTECKRCPVPL